MQKPSVRKIKGGWAARGNGIAVHGNTRKEAAEKYQERQVFYKELRKRSTNNAVEEQQNVEE